MEVNVTYQEWETIGSVDAWMAEGGACASFQRPAQATGDPF